MARPLDDIYDLAGFRFAEEITLPPIPFLQNTTMTIWHMWIMLCG